MDFKFLGFTSKKEVCFFVGFLIFFSILIIIFLINFSTPDFSKSSVSNSNPIPVVQDKPIQRIEIKMVDQFIDVGDY